MVNRTKPDKRADVLSALGKGMSMRGAAEHKRVSINTVYSIFRDAGDAAIDFLEVKLRKLQPSYLQIDEVHTWVRLKQQTVAARGYAPPGAGVRWIWIAIDPISKLVVSYRVGSRRQPDANAFLKDVAGRLAGRVQITTDRYKAYPRAIEGAFGANVDYAVIKLEDESNDDQDDDTGIRAFHRSRKRKKLTPQQRAELKEKAEPKPIIGHPDLDFATTAHVERFNLTLRRHLARLHRRTNAWSKTEDNLRRAIALFVFYYNFCKDHSSLGMTPAQAAGVDDSKWTLEDFLEIIEVYINSDACKTARRERAAPVERPSVSTGKFYFVYHDKKKNYTKIHLPTCVNARNGHGRGGNREAGVYTPCVSLDAAWAVAKQLAPDEASVCNICLGSYHTLPRGRPR